MRISDWSSDVCSSDLWNSCSRANCTVDREDNTMTTLTVYSDCEPGTALGVYTDFTAIRDQLAAIGVEFQRWETNQPLSANAGQDEVIAAYQNEIDALNARYEIGRASCRERVCQYV